MPEGQQQDPSNGKSICNLSRLEFNGWEFMSITVAWTSELPGHARGLPVFAAFDGQSFLLANDCHFRKYCQGPCYGHRALRVTVVTGDRL